VREKLLNDQLEMTTAYWRRALEELISDAVAVILFGPAALFAALEWGFREGFDIAPTPLTGFYPSWRLRLKRMNQLLSSEDRSPLRITAAFFPGQQNQVVERVNRQFEFLERTVTGPSLVLEDDLARLAYREVHREWARYASQLPALPQIASQRLRLAGLAETIGPLIQRLEAGLPPDEVAPGQYATLPQILNAAWFFRVGCSPRQTDSAITESKAFKERVNRLTLKAIETVELARGYSEWLEEIEVKPREQSGLQH
jgi:hypothetical protein